MSGAGKPLPAVAPRWERWARLQDGGWDVIVVGGGITGAGILLEAARRGLKAVLLEQHDVASGTSSRSSKMVHGGLRYLKQGRFDLTRESVLERRWLLSELPGLVEPFGYLLLDRKGQWPPKNVLRAGLVAYDRIAGTRTHRPVPRHELDVLVPGLSDPRTRGALYYEDAWVDDARLVLRVLSAAEDAGATWLNHAPVTAVFRGPKGNVRGVEVTNAVTGAQAEVTAKLVVNATGAWADRLREGVRTNDERIRPLRGSHLVLPAWKVPVAHTVTFMHPEDGRPVYVYPWMGATIVGTTDLDHETDLDNEPSITEREIDYLLAVPDTIFGTGTVGRGDVIATWAGVRPTVDTGAADPSKESRDHVVWLEEGLLTVTGGKLTTFRSIARDALDHAGTVIGDRPSPTGPTFRTPPVTGELVARFGADAARRLAGRYGPRLAGLVDGAQDGEAALLDGVDHCLAEVRWGARAEMVHHLGDLLLRRTRIGNLLPRGGLDHAEQIRQICQDELRWDDEEWAQKLQRYDSLWKLHYGPPAART
ncbi:MAG: glycerol-3-phosphate dehydrogenase/oxidase [Nitriliruptorales bacterium]|nr:glycerol-3-phosphate dehydrogenase/oxidase [Nitriliruptorales bacterium]